MKACWMKRHLWTKINHGDGETPDRGGGHKQPANRQTSRIDMIISVKPIDGVFPFFHTREIKATILWISGMHIFGAGWNELTHFSQVTRHLIIKKSFCLLTGYHCVFVRMVGRVLIGSPDNKPPRTFLRYTFRETILGKLEFSWVFLLSAASKETGSRRPVITDCFPVSGCKNICGEC